MIPVGVAAAQARISAIESRFGATARVQQAGTRGAGTVDFERVLAMARSAPEETVGAATVRSSTAVRPATEAPQVEHAMGPAGAPAELARYANGQIPATAMAPIGQGAHRLWGPAARAFQQMSAAAAQDGVAIRVSDSYRSFDEQVDLAERKGLYRQGGLAAVPGTSNHGWGRALDIDTSGGTVEWLRANAARFGFHEDVPREPWHWTYRPAEP